MQQNVSVAEELPEVFAIASTNVYFPDASVVGSEVGQLQANSPTYQAALQALQARNLQARDAEPGSAPFGWSVEDKGVTGNLVRSFTFVQDLGSDGGQDMGLFGHVISGADDWGLPIRQEVFEIVSKPSGGAANLDDIKSVATFADASIAAGGVAGFSLISRFVNCVRNSCAGACVQALGTCSGSYPSIVKCVAVRCGGCALKCGACAACNCGFWCKWAAGCCRG